MKHLVLQFKTKMRTPILPQLSYDTLNRRTLEYIYLLDSTIILFKNSKPIDDNDVAGVLSASSLVEVLGKEYRTIFREPEEEWGLSFEVWMKVRINDKIYYTDYKTHDCLCHSKYLDNLNQTLIVFAQSTGWGYYYDTGYPEYFHVLIANSSKSMIYQSGVLNFFNGDEFWVAELGWLDTNKLPDGNWEFVFDGYVNKEDGTIGDKYIEFYYVWNGETLEERNIH